VVKKTAKGIISSCTESEFQQIVLLMLGHTKKRGPEPNYTEPEKAFCIVEAKPTHIDECSANPRKTYSVAVKRGERNQGGTS